LGPLKYTSAENSYHNNDKVKPAPGVGEVLDEAEGQPLDGHLEGEDHGEDPVHVVQHVLQNWTFLQVGIFQSLRYFIRKFKTGSFIYLVKNNDNS
jgi:hypothetical protein